MSRLFSRKVLVSIAVIVAALVLLSVLRIPRVILPEISIAAEPVFEFDTPLGHVIITNTLLATLLVDILLVGSAALITRRMALVPGRWQAMLETLLEGFYGLVQSVSGPKWARKFFPVVMTIFLFVLVSNLLGLTPLYGGWGVLHPAPEGHEGHPVQWIGGGESIGILQRAEEDVPAAGQPETGEAPPAEQAVAGQDTEDAHAAGGTYILAPFFRSAATDLNTTLALALISVLLTQYFGIKAHGLGYFGKFISLGGIVAAFRKPGLGCVGRISTFLMGLIDLAVGLLETISEFSKIISFSFRLFGNVFAGEVLLGVLAFLIPYIVSLPFYGLEIFVGVVQALVFMMLSVAFFVLGISGHGSEQH